MLCEDSSKKYNARQDQYDSTELPIQVGHTCPESVSRTARIPSCQRPININQISSNGPPLNIICIRIEVPIPERTRIQASTSPVIHCGRTMTGYIHKGVSFSLKLFRCTKANTSTDA